MGSFSIPPRRIDRWVQNEGLEEKEGLLNLATSGTLVSMHTHGSKLKLTSSSLPLFAEGKINQYSLQDWGMRGTRGGKVSMSFAPFSGESWLHPDPTPGE